MRKRLTAVTPSPRSPVERAASLGPIRVLAVGISKYEASSGFRSISQCENDASTIRDCFDDVFQLQGHKSAIKQLTSKHDVVSRGRLISAIMELASEATPTERILFFFSGHGQRLGEKLYLVPQDAWSEDDPEGFVEFAKLNELIDASKARQKLIFLDACWSGPETSTSKTFVPATFSRSFLEGYLQKTSGTAIIASSSSSQPSTTKSPNPKLSLFTYHLNAALRGDPEALDDLFLTLPKLFEYVNVKVQRDARSYHQTQEPVLKSVASGVIVLGDFRSIINPAKLALDKFPVSSVQFNDERPMRVDDVLSNIKRWTYSTSYLAGRVNSTLPEHMEEELGVIVVALRLGFRRSSGEFIA